MVVVAAMSANGLRSGIYIVRLPNGKSMKVRVE